MSRQTDGSAVSSGFNLQNREVLADSNSTRVRPREDATCDLGSTTKRFKTLFYQSLDPQIPSGALGPQGYAGPIGPQGVIGSAGLGPVGFQGSRGFQGVRGFQGSDANVPADVVRSGGLTSTTGNFPVYTDGTGSLLQSSLYNPNSFLYRGGGSLTGDLDMNGHTITNCFYINGPFPNSNTRLANDIVSNAAGSVSGKIATFSGTSGKVVTDSGVTAANLVTGPASAVSGNISTFNGATGKIVQDSGTSLSSLATTAAMSTADNLRVLKAGDTMSGPLAMGANAVTGTGANTGGSYSASLTTDASSTSTGTLVTAGGLGCAKKAFIGSNTVIGPTQTLAVETMLTSSRNKRKYRWSACFCVHSN